MSVIYKNSKRVSSLFLKVKGVEKKMKFVLLLLCIIHVSYTYYNADGSGNNVNNPTWGQTNDQLIRLDGKAYYPDITGNTAAAMDYGNNRATCCEIESKMKSDYDVGNMHGISLLFVLFGQYSCSHDCALTDANAKDTIPFGMGNCTSSFKRSNHVMNSSPRQHENSVTSYLDLSPTYGHNQDRMNKLRLFKDGLLKTNENRGKFPPFVTEINDFDFVANPRLLDPKQLFALGDVRGNENIFLLAIHILYLLEHNRLATELKSKYPLWNDEQLFQRARMINIAQYQNVVYYEYGRLTLGNNYFNKYMKKYDGYNDTVHAQIFQEFSQGVYRVMHSQITQKIPIFYENFGKIYDITIKELFFNARIIKTLGLSNVINSVCHAFSRETYVTFATELIETNSTLFQSLHLGALDCQRSRDHGLLKYVDARFVLGLSVPTSFEDITRDQYKLDFLKSSYASVDDIDLFIGALAEDHIEDAPFGETFVELTGRQMKLLRDGDRFWFENMVDVSKGKLNPYTLRPTDNYLEFSQSELDTIKNTRFSDIIKRNTNIEKVQKYAFYMPHESFMGETQTTSGVEKQKKVSIQNIIGFLICLYLLITC